MPDIKVSIEEQYTNAISTLKSKGIAESEIREVLDMNCSTEQRLNKAIELGKKHNVTIKESAPRRIARKNGSFVEGPSGKQTEIVGLMRESGRTFVEASYLMGEVIKPGTVNPEFVKEAIRKSWLDYLPHIDESDLNALVARGVFAPKA